MSAPRGKARNRFNAGTPNQSGRHDDWMLEVINRTVRRQNAQRLFEDAKDKRW